MHLAKALEFRAVAVMAYDDDLLPLKSRLGAVAYETELDDVFDTERSSSTWPVPARGIDW